MTRPRYGSRPTASLDLEPDDAFDWRTDAKCSGSPGLMDAPIYGSGDRNSRLALVAWARPLIAKHCAGCPFTGPRGACDDVVKPGASYHDGIAAGALWMDGQRVET